MDRSRGAEQAKRTGVMQLFCLQSGYRKTLATKRIGDYLKEVQPGLSTKDVSGMTQEKLDALKDFLIQELDKPGKTLNLDIEKEAANFIDFLKDTKTITAPDANRGMEMLRLQGKTETIEKLRRELGATTKQPRNKIGQWIVRSDRRTLTR